jgi:Domain of unknown function (DUF4349)
MKQIFLVFILQLFLVACGQQPAGSSLETAPQAAPEPAPVQRGMAKMSADAMQTGAEQSLTEISEPDSAPVGDPRNDPTLRKYIALRHNLTVEASAISMQASFDAAVQHCEALNCQILSANFNKQTPYNPPSASLSVRLPPRNIDVFLNGLAKHGEVIQHGRTAEDKTNQVVDADARIKNLTDLRDRYRLMLTEKKAEFKDLVEIEKALSTAQAELDGIISYRKILALETDLVAVDIQFTAAQGITEQGFFAPVARALKDASSVMMESFGAVITFVMSAIPWLLIGIPLLWLIRRYWVKIKSKFM